MLNVDQVQPGDRLRIREGLFAGEVCEVVRLGLLSVVLKHPMNPARELRVGVEKLEKENDNGN